MAQNSYFILSMCVCMCEYVCVYVHMCAHVCAHVCDPPADVVTYQAESSGPRLLLHRSPESSL